MQWHDDEIDLDDEGRSRFKGVLRLTNDKNEKLAGICWFDDGGPFYAHAMDPTDPAVMRRIGPCTTLEGAKRSCFDAIEGRIENLSKRAGYSRAPEPPGGENG